MQKKRVFHGDTVLGILTIILGFGVAIYTPTDPTMSFTAQTSDGVPGAGFFPVLLGILLGFLGVILTIRGIRANGQTRFFRLDDPETRSNLKMLLKTILCIVIFFILWQLSKQFLPCAFLLVLALNFIFERSWKFNLIYSIIFVAFIYVAFVIGFSIQFNM